MERVQKLIIIGFVFCLLGSLQASDFRVFKDTQGREMEAMLTRVSGEDVYIERRDGLSTKVALSIFSKADKDYIQEWERKEILRNGAFKVRFSKETTQKNESSNGGIFSERYKAGYNIHITNTTQKSFDDIQVEYKIYKYKDALNTHKRREGDMVHDKGEVSLNQIYADSESVVQTKLFPMLETKLEPGYRWEEGGKETSKDRLEGVWIRVYVGDLMVHEESRPENLMRKEAW